MSLILVSETVRRLYGERLDAVLAAAPAGRRVAVFDPARSWSDAEAGGIEAAFLSSDVLGDSTKTRLAPDMAGFCDLLERAAGLRWLQVPSAGVDRPQFIRWAGRGVRITTAAGAASETVALTALTGILALSRRLPLWMQAKRKHEWISLRSGPDEPRELRGQRVLIVGTGRIGLELARMCRGLGLVTHGLRRSAPGPLPGFDRVGTLADLPEAAAEADWIVAACPLSPETAGLFNAAVFERCRPWANFINIARGAVAVEEDLVQALAQGTIEGAYLDVFAAEPLPPESPLWDMPNVLISPHSAGDTRGRHPRIAGIFLDNLERYLQGRELVNQADMG